MSTEIRKRQALVAVVAVVAVQNKVIRKSKFSPIFIYIIL
jgi:hypothetical protein